MKREIFRRPFRMTHRFGEYENSGDPYRGGIFDPKIPNGLPHDSPALEVQQHGLHDYRPTSSPVCKPDGREASINGPRPDPADLFGSPTPVSTKKRRA